jgi:hypothetical protein
MSLAVGFGYSGALAVNDVWTPEQLNAFSKTQGYAPGTAMSYNGMRKIEDRADLMRISTASTTKRKRQAGNSRRPPRPWRPFALQDVANPLDRQSRIPQRMFASPRSTTK